MAWVSCHMGAEGHSLGDEEPAHVGGGEKSARKVLVAEEGSYHELSKSCLSNTWLSASGRDGDAKAKETDRAGGWTQACLTLKLPLPSTD